jgi:hypothetical protein
MQLALYQRPEVFNRVRRHAAVDIFNRMIHHGVLVILVKPDVGLQRIGCRSPRQLEPAPE